MTEPLPPRRADLIIVFDRAPRLAGCGGREPPRAGECGGRDRSEPVIRPVVGCGRGAGVRGGAGRGVEACACALEAPDAIYPCNLRRRADPRITGGDGVVTRRDHERHPVVRPIDIDAADGGVGLGRGAFGPAVAPLADPASVVALSARNARGLRRCVICVRPRDRDAFHFASPRRKFMDAAAFLVAGGICRRTRRSAGGSHRRDHAAGTPLLSPGRLAGLDPSTG